MADPWAAFADAPPDATGPAKVPSTPAPADPWAKFPDAAPAPAPALGDAASKLLGDAGSAIAGSGTPTTAAAPPAEPSLIDKIMGGAAYAGGIADQGARGIANGAMNVAGIPVDLANLALYGVNKAADVVGLPAGARIPLSDTPFMGSQSLKNSLDAANNMTADAFGAPRVNPKPDNLPERVVNRVGEEVGAMAIPAGAALVKAREGIQAARELPGLARMFVEPAAVDPARFVAKETAAATAAGTGAAAVNEATGRSTTDTPNLWQNLGDMFGALMGVGIGGIGKGVVNSGRDIVKAVRSDPTYTNKIVDEKVTDSIIDAAGMRPAQPGQPVDTAPLVDQIMGNPKVGDTIPGYQDSLADRTKNPGLAAVEYGRQSGTNAGTYAQRRADNTTAIDNAMRQSEPQANPGAFSDELALERNRRLTDAEVLARNATDAADAAVVPLRPTDTTTQRGDAVRAGLEDSRDAARQRTDDAYRTADINGKTIDPTDLTAQLDGVDAGLTAAERTLVPNGLLDRVKALGRAEADGPVDTGILDASGNPITRAPAPPEPVSMREATDLRSELQKLQRAALGDPHAEKGGRNAARVLGQYIDAVDTHIARSLPPDELTALEAARGTKLDEANAFTRKGDPVAAALARNEGGEPRMANERVAGSFTTPQAMDRLFAQADTPATRQAIRNEILSHADLGTADGIAGFRQQYGEQLNRFPGLADDLEAARVARAGQETATTAQSDLMREIGPQGRGVVAKYLQYGNENAEKAMKSVLAAKDPKAAMHELLTFVGDDPKAVEGARKVFWNIMQKTARRGGETTSDVSGSQPWMPKALGRFINDPPTRAVAERLYRDNPEHLDNITKISEALQGVDLRNAVKAPNTSGTTQGVNQLLTPETLQSRYYAWRSGKISLSFLATSIGSVVARRAVSRAQNGAIERVLDEALLNPEAAATLLKENNPANRAALARKAKGWLGNEASTFIDMVTPETKDDETKKAVMAK